MNALLPGLLAASGILIAAYLVLPLFPFLYIVLRWRSGGVDEPGVGTLGAVLYFRVLSAIAVLASISLLLYAWWSKEENESLSRTAYGILAAGAVFFLLNLGLGCALPEAQAHHPARRVFGGFLLVLAGLVALVAITGLSVTLFEKRPEHDAAIELRDDRLKGWIAVGLVWGPTYVASLVRMARSAARLAG